MRLGLARDELEALIARGEVATLPVGGVAEGRSDERGRAAHGWSTRSLAPKPLPRIRCPRPETCPFWQGVRRRQCVELVLKCLVERLDQGFDRVGVLTYFLDRLLVREAPLEPFELHRQVVDRGHNVRRAFEAKSDVCEPKVLSSRLDEFDEVVSIRPGRQRVGVHPYKRRRKRLEGIRAAENPLELGAQPFAFRGRLRPTLRSVRALRLVPLHEDGDGHTDHGRDQAGEDAE